MLASVTEGFVRRVLQTVKSGGHLVGGGGGGWPVAGV